MAESSNTPYNTGTDDRNDDRRQQQDSNDNTKIAGNHPTASIIKPSSQQQQQQQLENIRVAVRLRPFTKREKQRDSKLIVDIEQNTVALYSPKYGDTNVKKFTFDYSYWSHDGFKLNDEGLNVPDYEHPNGEKFVGQEKVFDDLGVFLLNNALEGYNSALLAYGQTGSGKSYTVSGYGKNEGILPRFARALFTELDKRTSIGNLIDIDTSSPTNQDELISTSPMTKGQLDRSSPDNYGVDGKTSPSSIAAASKQQQPKNRYEIYFSMIEIYNEVVRDLLVKRQSESTGQVGGGNSNMARRGLKIREHPKRGFFVEGISSYPCLNKEDIESRIEEGLMNKSIAATSMNETSSRGHTIYEFHIKQFKLKDDLGSSDVVGDNEILTTSVVQLVDLAGSERLAVHVTGQLGGDSFIGSRSNSPSFSQPPIDHQSTTSGPSKSTASSGAQGSSTKSINTNTIRRKGRGTRVAAHKTIASPSNVINNSQQPGSASSSNSYQSKRSDKNGGHSSSLRLADNQHHHHQRFKESVSINQSLSALGNCIQVMSQYSQQQQQQNSTSYNSKAAPKIPYRDSVLTKLLNRCCLSGNSKVVIIATLSPTDTNYDDTLSTLRFADRAKQIRTHATINRMSKREIVDVLQKENKRLKKLNRLLFGSSANMVNMDQIEVSDDEVNDTNDVSAVDQDQLITSYEQIQNEVMRKVMSDAKNEAVVKEIKNYTHRPSSGKRKDLIKMETTTIRAGNLDKQSTKANSDNIVKPKKLARNSRLTRSLTINNEHDISNEVSRDINDNSSSIAIKPLEDIIENNEVNNIESESETVINNDKDNVEDAQDIENMNDIDGIDVGIIQSATPSGDLETRDYRKRLMEDTYDYALPVAEINAVAKEMQIKVNYGLKILTGEEQLPETYGNYFIDTSNSDSFSSASGPMTESGDGGGGGNSSNDTTKEKNTNNNEHEQHSTTSTATTTTIFYEDATNQSPAVTDVIKPDSLDIPPALFIHVHVEKLNMDFYWTKEKFQSRRYKILELYGAWADGGKPGLVEYLIEQSKYQGDYLIDPFVDDPLTTQVLIGHAQVTLKPLSHLGDMHESHDILDINDEIVGSITIQVIPCHTTSAPQQSAAQTNSTKKNQSSSAPPFRSLNETELQNNLIEDPRELLGKRLIFLIKILSCRNLPNRYCQIYCQYTLNRDKSYIRTNFAKYESTTSETMTTPTTTQGQGNQKQLVEGRDSNNSAGAGSVLKFNHLHYVTIEKVDQDILDFLEHGFLAIQVIGRYKAFSKENDFSNQDQLRQYQDFAIQESSSSSSPPSAAPPPPTTTTTKPGSTSARLTTSTVPTIVSKIIDSINKYKYNIEQQSSGEGSGGSRLNGINYSNVVYTNSSTDSAKSNRVTSTSGIIDNKSGPSSVASTNVSLFNQKNDDDDGADSINSLSQENIVDMILTKRRLDRAENRLYYIKKSVSLAERYNRKQLPINTVKRLLDPQGQEIEFGSIEGSILDNNIKENSSSKNSGCSIQ